MSVANQVIIVSAFVCMAVLLFAQTLRVNNAWKVVSDLRWNLTTAKSDRDWHEQRLVRAQQDYHSLTEELAALKSAPNLEKKLAGDVAILRGSNSALHDDKIALTKRIAVLTADNNLKSHEIIDLKKKASLKSEAKLTEAMSGLCRFIAANQWMLEKNKDLRDSLESVLEVSQSVESFRTDF
jgi:hypothetical protein